MQFPDRHGGLAWSWGSRAPVSEDVRPGLKGFVDEISGSGMDRAITTLPGFMDRIWSAVNLLEEALSERPPLTASSSPPPPWFDRAGPQAPPAQNSCTRFRGRGCRTCCTVISFAPAYLIRRAAAIPDSGPKITVRISEIFFSTRLRALIRAAMTTTAELCWSSLKTGMSSSD